MLVSKSVLQRTIKALQRFDPTGSPFIGLQWGNETPLFHRSGATGIIESLGYDRGLPALVVSLPHLANTLASTAAEQVDLATDRTGILSVTGTTEMGVDDLRVYTVRQNIPWAKTHDIGETATEIDHEAFKGINTSHFELASPPVLRRSKLMLATNHGIIMRNGVPVETYPYPREAFLRAISTLPIEKLYTTRGGYWGAVAGGLRVLVAGHRVGDSVFDTYAVGATTITEIAAERILWSLKSGSDMAAEGSHITIDSVQGVQVRDEYGHLNKFTFGAPSEWPVFMIRPRTARVIHDALSQAKDETVLLQQVDTSTMRMTRGLWEVSFKFFTPESTKAPAAR